MLLKNTFNSNYIDISDDCIVICPRHPQDLSSDHILYFIVNIDVLDKVV